MLARTKSCEMLFNDMSVHKVTAYTRMEFVGSRIAPRSTVFPTRPPPHITVRVIPRMYWSLFHCGLKDQLPISRHVGIN